LITKQGKNTLPPGPRCAHNDAPNITKRCTYDHQTPPNHDQPEVDAALVALSQAEDRPQAKIVTEILIEFAPMMLDMAKLHAQIKAGKKVDAKRTVQHMLGDQMAALLVEQAEMFKGKKK